MPDRLGPPSPQLEPGIEAQRARWREAKRRVREREVERASAPSVPAVERFVMPRMPGTLALIRRWLRQAHDAYSDRKISSAELTEARRSAGAVSDLYRTGAELRKAEAAIRSAEASERLVEALTQLEHGGQAFLLLQRLQGAADGPRRPLPGRVVTPSAGSVEEPA